MNSQPLFRFVQVTDVHVKVGVDIVSPLVDAINSERFHPRPDRLVCTGDLAIGRAGQPEVVQEELTLFKQLITPLAVPFQPVLGNHDVIAEEEPGQTFRQLFDHHEVVETEQWPGDVTAVYWNEYFNRDGQPSLLKDNVDLLDATLSALTDQTVLLFSHVPPFPPRKRVPAHHVPKLTGPAWGGSGDPEAFQAHFFAHSLDETQELRARIAAHPRRVIHYSGHCHVHSRFEDRGQHYICTGALTAFPWEYRLIELWEDRLVHRCFRPHDVERHPVFYPNCIDDDHHDVASYHRGNTNERDFEISIV